MKKIGLIFLSLLLTTSCAQQSKTKPIFINAPKAQETSINTPQENKTTNCEQILAAIEKLESAPEAEVYTPTGTAGAIPFSFKRDNTELLKKLHKEAKSKNCISLQDQPDIIAPRLIETNRNQLTFDQCFTKCKELTSRTNEQCFDSCK